ncbi:signal peptidase I [Shouchella clausii]|uniref:Signal peptidase I n=2 Tax=Shouchella clausii TaxID=79880 RepID=Q5WFN9_SHOC1|nr:signal peptidase I [Shouchella clausii]KKI87811.1 signal peptidase I [Shouchella clausii]MDO7267270.1 signal peptidase I [Shouchella clausii]MDO7282342.1 signal peptidase I [Shouchella clausii]MDO7287776.1 signal peptidase I [Shouchella clausii]MDO7302437.1 signal peptidase I [Shouchella clausii]
MAFRGFPIEWAKAICIALCATLLVRLFLYAPIVVDGHSMQPTLDSGDKMIVNQIGYVFIEPKRFDIVVFHAPGGKDYIKRIIGLPGDHLKYENDTLYINGKETAEPYLNSLKQTLYGDQLLTGDFTLEELIGEEVIPDDYYFMMGDNRRLSKDSRDIGLIPKSEIIGKANVIFYPFEHISIVND